MKNTKNSVKTAPARIVKIESKSYQILNSFSRKHTIAIDLKTGERYTISSLCFLDDDAMIKERIAEVIAHRESVKRIKMEGK